MKNNISIWSFTGGAIIGSIYFFIPTDSPLIMGVHAYKLISAGSFLGLFLLLLYLPAHPAKSSLLFTVGSEMTIIISIISDVLKDRTSHNLFPFEIIVTSLMILLPAFAGAYFAELIKYLKTSLFTSTGRKLD